MTEGAADEGDPVTASGGHIRSTVANHHERAVAGRMEPDVLAYDVRLVAAAGRAVDAQDRPLEEPPEAVRLQDAPQVLDAAVRRHEEPVSIARQGGERFRGPVDEPPSAGSHHRREPFGAQSLHERSRIRIEPGKERREDGAGRIADLRDDVRFRGKIQACARLTSHEVVDPAGEGVHDNAVAVEDGAVDVECEHGHGCSMSTFNS